MDCKVYFMEVVMTQQEKTRITQERILDAALKEFRTKSYEAASINTICSASHLSKGLIYHNFKNKDDLYLQCVRICYDGLLKYLKKGELNYQDSLDGLQTLLARRRDFFREHPLYGNIFFNTILQPPAHLLAPIREIRKDYDDFLAASCRCIFAHSELRGGITTDIAVEYFMIFQEMFNGYFQGKLGENGDFSSLVQDHEGKLPQLLDLMLYGIAAPK